MSVNVQCIGVETLNLKVSDCKNVSKSFCTETQKFKELLSWDYPVRNLVHQLESYKVRRTVNRFWDSHPKFELLISHHFYSAVVIYGLVCCAEYCLTLFLFIVGALCCIDDRQCGWNAICVGRDCQCVPGYNWTTNFRDCYSGKLTWCYSWCYSNTVSVLNKSRGGWLTINAFVSGRFNEQTFFAVCKNCLWNTQGI